MTIRHYVYVQQKRTGEQFYEFANQDFQAVLDIMGDKKFVFGDELTSFDLTFYGFVTIYGARYEWPGGYPGTERMDEYRSKPNSTIHLLYIEFLLRWGKSFLYLKSS